MQAQKFLSENYANNSIRYTLGMWTEETPHHRPERIKNHYPGFIWTVLLNNADLGLKCDFHGIQMAWPEWHLMMKWWSSPWSLQPVKFQHAGLQQESNKEMKESAGKPTDDTQEIMQDDENNTENTQQKLRAAEGKFEDAVWPCHRSLMCDHTVLDNVYYFQLHVCMVLYTSLFCYGESWNPICR